MPESVDAKIMAYMRGHWPSDVRPEWRVRDEEYAGLVERVVNDWTEEADRERKFLRLAGQSGSGKTTQLLPIAEEMMPRSVLVAARKFVQYHPYVTEIENEYGKENLRRKTDEFSTIMMFLTLKMLIEKGFNIILDVTLLDVAVESVLVNLLKKENYDARMMMVALAREISDEFILKRKGRIVAKATADEFWRAQSEAVKWYAKNVPNMRVTVWSMFDYEPVYDGNFAGAPEVFERYWQRTGEPNDAEELLASKKCWLKSQG